MVNRRDQPIDITSRHPLFQVFGPNKRVRSELPRLEKPDQIRFRYRATLLQSLCVVPLLHTIILSLNGAASGSITRYIHDVGESTLSLQFGDRFVGRVLVIGKPRGI